MDTTEELNGTYFYNGLPNLTNYELFFWILLEETENSWVLVMVLVLRA
ncbi:hypothetical protein M1E08_17785 [Erwinia sp. PK3-005]